MNALLRSPGSRRALNDGSVLVMTLAMAMGLLAIVTSMYYSSRTQLVIEEESRYTLQSELMASSALEFAISQIKEDVDWQGTEGDWIELGESRFRIDRLSMGDPSEIHVRLTGESGESRTVHEAILASDKSGSFGDNALIILGGELDINQVEIDGDVFFVDSLDGLLEYDPVTGSWQKPSFNLDPNVTVKNTTFEGDVYTYTGTEVLSSQVNNTQKFALATQTSEVYEYSEPTKVPVWDLDPLLAPSPNHVVLYTDSISHVTTNLTVVVVADPGQEILVNQCELNGGLVVYAESDLDYRMAPRNTLLLNQSSFGSGGGGIAPDLGIIAPGAKLRIGNMIENSAGAFFFHSVNNLHNSDLEGSLTSVNGIENMHGVKLKFQPVDLSVGGGLGGLLDEESQSTKVEVTKIWESFDVKEEAQESRL